MPSSPLPITLALQGGGTHSAFAWGVIDQLLLDGEVDIQAITATSGGALQAAVLASALAEGGPHTARDRLQQFWRKVSVAASMLPLRAPVMDKLLSNVGLDLSPSSIALDYITRMFSPYQFNLFDLNPLRSIVEELVDFDRLRANTTHTLMLNATHVKTGERRVFSNAELSLEVVMAAACLPFMFKTVTIDGEPYWDGGYTGNPALSSLIGTRAPRDVVLAESMTCVADDIPTRAADILDRATELSFHHALITELSAVEGKLTVHRVAAPELIAGLGRASKLNADWDFLVYVHDLGAQAAADWMASRKQA